MYKEGIRSVFLKAPGGGKWVIPLLTFMSISVSLWTLKMAVFGLENSQKRLPIMPLSGAFCVMQRRNRTIYIASVMSSANTGG
jgi:hypothetical protein